VLRGVDVVEVEILRDLLEGGAAWRRRSSPGRAGEREACFAAQEDGQTDRQQASSSPRDESSSAARRAAALA
jgi:hypothetical protein